MRVKGVIFDLDGTLLDTLDGIIYTLNKLGECWGKKFTRNDFLPLWGLSAEEILSKLFNTDDRVIVRELAEKWINEFKNTIIKTNLVKVFPDTIQVLSELRKLGLKIGISTSAPRIVTEFVFDKFNLRNYVDAYTTRDDVKRGKPDPEMFIKTAMKLGLRCGEIIVVGDTKFDIIAGMRGGFITVLIDHYNRYLNNTFEPKPNKIVKNFKEFLEYVKNLIKQR